VQHSLNYTQLAAEAFRVCSGLIDQADCYDFQYSQLDEAVTVFNRLATSAVTGEAGN
jgi:hypothetical protein